MHHLIVPSYAGVFNKRGPYGQETDDRYGIKIFNSVGFNVVQC